MSLVVDMYSLGVIGTNCYVVRADRGSTDAAVVDPGWDAAALRLELARTGARCAAILLTHTHWDHVGAVAELAEGTGAPVYVSEEAAPALADPKTPIGGLTLRGWTDVTHVVAGETLDAAGIAFEVLSVPGHAPGHVAFAADGSVFSGDVLFAGGVGRVDIAGGDWDTLLASIRLLVERFPPETTVYSGHGPPTTIGVELARNPFLAELRAAST
jgi:glyoxylase-like metal-dependent hydrolase (beta-lactamase superfamily II)